MIHLLRDCCWARQIWDGLIADDRVWDFYSGDVVEWVHSNTVGKLAGGLEMEWYWIFLVGLWSIWVRRNKKLFQAFLLLVIGLLVR